MMRAYKFKTRISEKGIIQIPIDPKLYNKEVEITIVPKFSQRKRQLKATDFVNKWAGFLKNDDIDDIKYDYLSEKYK